MNRKLDRIRALAADILSSWNAADTPAADCKEIVRTLVERVTVTVPGNTEQVVVRIEWIRGTATEHAMRRPISRYDRLHDFPRPRRLIEEEIEAGQTARQMAERLDRGEPATLGPRRAVHAGAGRAAGLHVGSEPEAPAGGTAGG